MREKILCKDCGWTGHTDQMLTAKNPFNEKEDIQACPNCKEVTDTLFMACEEPGCWKQVTCGTPTKNGYKSTCSKHQPEKG